VSEASTTRLEVRNLALRRGRRRVIEDVSFRVERGETLGLLGPNGCGKTSVLMALVGLVGIERGEILLDGTPVDETRRRLRERAGFVFQSPALDDRLTARENLSLAATLYGRRGADRTRRVGEALALAELEDRADEPVRKLSGGMRRRVETARALLHDPDLLLLDEPTTGLDPASFRRLWGRLREWVEARGGAILATTHRPDEAERCDRLAVLHEGRVVAEDTPEALRAGVGGDVVEIELDGPEAAAARLRDALGLEAEARPEGLRLVADGGPALVPRIVEALLEAEVRRIEVHRPDLADAYLAITGRGLEDEGEEGRP
jgi:ABC-2 type transport system ATP-binding protein